MKFLLDTCVLSDFAKGDVSTRTHLNRIPPRDIAVSTITEMEISYGLRLNPRATRLHAVMDELFAAIELLSFDRAAARAAGELRASLRRRGTPIGAYDILIAGVALANDLTLVTSNLGEFEGVPELRIENWRR
jgi:tRNA(fMet)-specific endonuclease VapC